MQGFVNISSKVAFILKTMSDSLHRLTRTFVGFLFCRVRSSFPEQGVTCHNSYTLQRCITFPTRDLRLCCTVGSMSMFKLPWFEAQPKIQANHCPLRDPHVPLVYAMPTSWITQMVSTDRQMPELSWDVEGSHPYAAYPLRILINMHATRITATTCTSGFIREEEDTADFSVPFQISWLTRNIQR